MENLFDTTIVLSGQEAYFGVLFATITADEQISEEKVQALWSAVDQSNLYREFNDDQFENLMDHLSWILEEHGHYYLLELATRYLPCTLKESIFTRAIDLLLVECCKGLESNLAFINDLKSLLKISDQYSKEVIYVMAVKNMLV